MNKISLLALVIAALASHALHAGRLENLTQFNGQMTVDRDWFVKKNLFVTVPELGNNPSIQININNLAQEFSNTASAYLVTTNPEQGQVLADELVRYYEIAYQLITKNPQNQSIVNQAKRAIEPLTNEHGHLLLEKAGELGNNELALVLAEYGVE